MMTVFEKWERIYDALDDLNVRYDTKYGKRIT